MKTAFIDWTDNSLNYYLFVKLGRGYKLDDSKSIPLDNGLNAESLNSLSIDDVRNVFLSIPADLLTLRELNLPFSDRNKISETISFELEGLLLKNPENYSVDHVPIQSEGEGCRVLAVCLEKTRLQEIIDILSGANLDPKVITSVDLRISGYDLQENIVESDTDIHIREEAAMKEIANSSVNLRQEEHSFTGDIKRVNKSLRVTAMLVLALLLIIGSNVFYSLTDLEKEQKLLSNQLERSYHKIFPADKKILDLERQFNGNKNLLINKKDALVGIPVLGILKSIADNTNDKITLYEFNTDEKGLLIRGAAVSFEEVESLKDDLSAVFKDVKVLDSNALSDRKINFTITLQENSV